MGDAGFRGTSTSQDGRYGDKQKRLYKTLKFPACFEKRVDISKVNLQALQPWTAERITALLGFEDEVVIEFVNSMLIDAKKDISNRVDPRALYVNLIGFLESKTGEFMTELWDLLLDAQTTTTGIPQVIFQKKVQEVQKAREEEERRAEAMRERTRREREIHDRVQESRDRERGGRSRFDRGPEPPQSFASPAGDLDDMMNQRRAQMAYQLPRKPNPQYDHGDSNRSSMPLRSRDQDNVARGGREKSFAAHPDVAGPAFPRRRDPASHYSEYEHPVMAGQRHRDGRSPPSRDYEPRHQERTSARHGHENYAGATDYDDSYRRRRVYSPSPPRRRHRESSDRYTSHYDERDSRPAYFIDRRGRREASYDSRYSETSYDERTSRRSPSPERNSRNRSHSRRTGSRSGARHHEPRRRTRSYSRSPARAAKRRRYDYERSASPRPRYDDRAGRQRRHERRSYTSSSSSPPRSRRAPQRSRSRTRSQSFSRSSSSRSESLSPRPSAGQILQKLAEDQVTSKSEKLEQDLKEKLLRNKLVHAKSRAV